MINSIDVEYQINSTGYGGAEYEVFFPYGGSQLYMISDRDCAIMRRNREEVLAAYVLEDLRRHSPELDEVRLVRR